MTSTLSSQRFCLRWNNHQSNLLSVFDQLLHDESFVDVTLAVEGRFLRAHKMVLSACSPYFQALFVGHPDKHPIVILKDVPYCDMRSLLDFMYRGEVSVDQDRLTAFLKVAESLRIKGLTEVNEEKCDLPSITSSLLSSVPPPVVTTHTPPPPHLHRIHPASSHKRNIVMPSPSATSSNPLLGSALTAPKRKRGRPRKLSGSSGGVPASTPGLIEGATSSGTSSRPQSGVDGTGNGDVENSPRLSSADSLVAQGSPELLEVKMSGVEFQHSSATNSGASKRPTEGENGTGPGHNSSADESKTPNKETPTPTKQVKEEPEPTPGPSSQDPGQIFVRPSSTNDPEQFALDPIIMPKLEVQEDGEGESEGNGGDGERGDGINSPVGDHQLISSPASASSTPSGRPPVKRRARRRATSASQDPAEQLTEMSVRGLNLFRYASISEGVYQCTECAKSDVQKTFKNKYSFQRHAFLYHEGHQRKVFPCPVCSKEFSRPDKMKNHMKTVHDCFMPKDCVFPLGFFLPH